MGVKSGIALVVAPTLALATQSVLYSMVTPACSTQTRIGLHATAAISLLVTVVLAVLAYRESSVAIGEPASPDHDGAERPVPFRFLGDVAAAVAALSALVIVGLWFPLWVLAPCEL